ncbi:MAG: hypothetical protein ACOC3X_03485 [Nanoarchaeota archaeon]
MNEELVVIETLDNKNKDKDDLKSMLNRKSYSSFELDEFMMEE